MSGRIHTSGGTVDPRDLWLLDKDITFLNHGSFGACPKAVLDAQSALRERLERDPVLFLARELEGLLDASRETLGSFIDAAPEGMAFVPNATTGVNTVLRSLDLKPGDEMLTTDHVYPSCRYTLQRIAADTGAVAVEAAVRVPIGSPEEVTRSLLSRTSPRTRICLIDHVTSPTGIVFPVAAIAREMRDRGIDVLVDGAHAPGMIPLSVRDVGAAYYTGNCHKWLCAPKGSAFLYVRADKREAVRPLVVSLGYGAKRTDRSPFHLRFDWTGTSDPTAYLSVAKAIEYMGSLLPGGWPELMRRNRNLALQAGSRLREALGAPALCPDEMTGSLAALQLPDGDGTEPSMTGDNDPLRRELFDSHSIEVPIIAWPSAPRRLIRVSAQIYNKQEDYELLASALRSTVMDRK